MTNEGVCLSYLFDMSDSAPPYNSICLFESNGWFDWCYSAALIRLWAGGSAVKARTTD